MITPIEMVLIALGGGLGSMLRAAIGAWASRFGPAHLGTLGVNLSGSFLIGVAAAVYLSAPSAPLWGFDIFALGVLGGYTTVSSFALQVQASWMQGDRSVALTYGLASLLLCPLAAWVPLAVSGGG